MVNSEDIKGFVEGTLRPLSEGKKVKDEGKNIILDVDADSLPDSFYNEEEKAERARLIAEREKEKGAEGKKEKEVKKEKKGTGASKVKKNRKEESEKRKAVKKAEDKKVKEEKAEVSKVRKNDKVIKELEKLEDDSVDLIFFDPFNRLGKKEVTFKTSEDRDKYIARVQEWLKLAYTKLNPKGGNMVIGACSFSMSSFGDKIFPRDDVKRMLSWYSEEFRGDLPLERGYIPAVVPFLWGVRGRPWTHNLLGEEKFFDGEFKVNGGKGNDPKAVAEEVIQRFTNEGDVVLEVFGKGSPVKEAAEELGRGYVTAFK